MKVSKNIFLIVICFTVVVALSFFFFKDANFDLINMKYEASSIVPQVQHKETVKVLILSYSRYIQSSSIHTGTGGLVSFYFIGDH